MGVRTKRRWLQIKRSSTRQALQSMLADKRTLKRPNCSICVAIQPSGELCLMSQIVPTSSHAQNLTGQTVNYFGPVLKGAQNPLAFQVEHRIPLGLYVKSPLDQMPIDPWSSFPGDLHGNLTERLAHTLFDLITPC